MNKLLTGILLLFIGLVGYYVLYTTSIESTYYVLVGPPGSGKGTLAAKLGENRDLPVITASQVLRQAMDMDRSLELKVRSLMDKGQLVSDEIINGWQKS